MAAVGAGGGGAVVCYLWGGREVSVSWWGFYGDAGGGREFLYWFCGQRGDDFVH